MRRTFAGLTVFLTGLPGAGKSSMALELRTLLEERDSGCVTLLDGDVVRRYVSPELGFSKHDRDLNVLRAGRLAQRLSKENGVCICAFVAPYDDARKQARALVEAAGGGFVLIHVATSLAVCEARDLKGLYAKARAGILSQFTGVSDPYEVPFDADLVIDAACSTAQEGARQITSWLENAGYLGPERQSQRVLWSESQPASHRF